MMKCKSKLRSAKQYFLLLGIISLFFVTSAWSATYYISPTGSDSANGLSTSAPIATFSHSYALLSPGDTLIIMDGTYNESLAPKVSGTSGSPITFQAENRGQAILQMASSSNAILVWSTSTITTSYITIDGLIARSYGEYGAIKVGSDDNVTETQMTNNIIIKNTGAFGSANLTNLTAFSIGNNARDSLFEDVWSYGFGRKAMQVFGSLRITVRRAVLRYDYWDGSGYKPNDPRVTFSGYNTQDSVFENIIIMDSAPTPSGRSGDRHAFVASGNETPAIVSNSARNKYFGLLAIDNYGTGIEINGGTGDPGEDIEFKDIIIWNQESSGINLFDNDDGSKISFVTSGNNGSNGIRVNPSPNYTIANEVITNCLAINNTKYGFYYGGGVTTFINNSATENTYGGEIESSYAPTINYLIKPTMVSGHERGGTMIYQYVDGSLTGTKLWPWANEILIKQHMCNSTDLATSGRVSSNGEGWEPAWCASGKTLTTYVWEYLGNKIPSDIYGNETVILPPNVNSIETSVSQTTLNN